MDGCPEVVVSYSSVRRILSKSLEPYAHLCSVNELARQDEVARCNFLLQAAYSTECDDSFDAQALEGCNVCSRRHC